MASCQVLSPAKLNLFLGVEPNCDDKGMHKLSTILHCVELADTVVLSYEEGEAAQGENTAAAISCECHPTIEGLAPQDNLAYKAAQAMYACFGKSGKISISILKQIPAQAGLGGGSSNAAATIKGLAHLWGLDEQDAAIKQSLHEIAASLGADVPFFLCDKPAYMGGVGEQHLESFEPLEGCVLIVKPQGGVSTREAYQRFDERPDKIMPNELILIGMREGDTELVASHVANNLELAVASLLPQISHVQAWLGAQRGSNNPHVSGSGSAVFAIFDSDEEASEAAEIAEKRGWWVAKTQLSGHGVMVVDKA